MTKEEPPRTVWHYTTPVGLAGIVQNCRLWATHAAFLNDPLELRIDDQRTVAIWQSLVDDHPELAPVMDHFSQHEGLIEGDNYLTSFSADGDSLPQWRAYAANGRGYAIAFDLRSEHWSYDRGLFSIRKCIYGCEALEGALRAEETLLARLAAVTHKGRTVFKPAWQKAALANSCLKILSSYKDEAYRSEAEWRLLGADVFSGPSQVLFRPSAFGLTPYLEVPFERSALREIRIGPGLPADPARKAVELLLAKAELENVEVTGSAVAYRP